MNASTRKILAKILKFMLIKTLHELHRSWYFGLVPIPPHVLDWLRGPPPGCGRSVTDFWGWDAHEALLRCPDEIHDYEVPGGALTKLPRPWSPSESSPSRRNSHGRTGNRTRDFMISSQKLWPLDHEAGHAHEYKHKLKNMREKMRIRKNMLYSQCKRSNKYHIPTKNINSKWRV
jgi:hypothetical protein